MKTYLLFVFLIGNALAFTTSRSSYTGPMDMLMKKVGFGLYKLDRKICDAQDQIEEIKEVLTAHEEQLTALETGQEQQNGRLDTLEESQVMQDGLIASLQTGQDFQAGEIVALQDSQGIQDGLINDLQIEQGIQGGEIVELGEVNDEQDVSLTDLEGRVTSLEENFPVILVGGTASEGNVYAYSETFRTYWPICDDDWDDVDAGVVCRMLGFADGTYTEDSQYSDVPYLFILDEVDCDGTESSIFDCAANSLFNHDCSSGEGAGVKCV